MNNFAGAFFNAGHATGALFVVEYGKIVHHGYRTVRAVLGAYAAAYASDLALLHNVLALAVGGAGHIYGRLYGYPLNDVLGAGHNAGTAGSASFGDDYRNAVFNFYGLFGAGFCAVAAAKATSLAQLVAAEQSVAGRAGVISFIPERVGSIYAAVALYYCNCGLVFEHAYSKQFGNLLLLFGGSYVAVGKVCLAAGKLFCKGAATGAAAAAAVSTCKVFKYLGNFFVYVYFEEFSHKQNGYYKHNRNSCEYARHNAYRLPGFGVYGSECNK